MIKQRPQFDNEDDEAKFWAEHDFTDYVKGATQVNLSFSSLKPSTQSVTVRLPKPLVHNLKLLANEQDVPYQSLLKTFLDEKVKERLALKKKSVRLST
jgi:predicted DNA binding CopG/RHH family protein